MDTGAESAESANASSEVLQPETDFTEFYCEIISKLYDLKCRQISNDVRKALIDMRRLKHQADNIQERIYFSYKIPPVRCAYMYAYSVLHTMMVYSEFSSFLEKNRRFLFPVFNRASLTMCCLGGGPGTEAIAICKSVNDFYLETSTKSDESILEVRVTVIDKLPHWKREESAVINAMNDSSNLLHSKRLFLHTDFMKADLLKPFEKSLQEKIKEADILTIVKLGGSIQEKNSDDCSLELQNMVKNVADSMDEGSLLFMLDNAGGSVFYKMMNILRERKDPFFLRKSFHKEYDLDLKTVKKIEDLTKSKKDTRFHPIRPTGKGKVSCCLWIKDVSPDVKENNASCKKDKLKAASNRNTHSSVSKTEKIDENSDINPKDCASRTHASKQRNRTPLETEQLNEKGKKGGSKRKNEKKIREMLKPC